jgi:hypothetical protein
VTLSRQNDARSLEHKLVGTPVRSATIERAMADQTPTVSLDQQLEEIGAQLAWVRDYL